jgi:cyclic pyranopterin phosphate synthase
LRLYAFDVTLSEPPSSSFLPLAARRALDRAGLKLSLAGFRSLAAAEQSALVGLGSAEHVDVAAVALAVSRAVPAAEKLEPVRDPDPEGPPLELVQSLEADQPLPEATWRALSALDRYALLKVARSDDRARRRAAYAEIVGSSAYSSHLAPQGGVRMVSVSTKQASLRRAEAESRVHMNREAFERAAHNAAPKGDVLGAARLAAIMAAKRTSDIIPLCHPLSLTRIDVDFGFDEAASAIDVRVAVEAFDRTGVEMEALTAASVAALTIYDMLKSFDRGMELGPARLSRKSGGASGDYLR